MKKNSAACALPAARAMISGSESDRQPHDCLTIRLVCRLSWNGTSLPSIIEMTISAALRFGYVICPAGMGEAGRLTAQHGFFGVPKVIE